MGSLCLKMRVRIPGTDLYSRSRLYNLEPNENFWKHFESDWAHIVYAHIVYAHMICTAHIIYKERIHMRKRMYEVS
jgi:hypothetical protein